MDASNSTGGAEVLKLPRRHRTSVAWKIAGTLLATITLFGCLTIVIVHSLVGKALREEVDQRALAIATSLSDGALGYLTSRNALLLNAILTKYALLDGVAYAWIQDREGKVVAHSLTKSRGGVPSFSADDQAGRTAQIRKRQVLHWGRPVYETSVPILGGQMGAVHVGLWGDLVEQRIQRALFPIVGLIAVLLLIGIIASGILSRQIIRPIIQLRSVADEMTKGNLDTPVGIDTRDEIGDLAMSLERMRASLKAAMMRLTRETQYRNGANDKHGSRDKIGSATL